MKNRKFHCKEHVAIALKMDLSYDERGGQDHDQDQGLVLYAI